MRVERTPGHLTDHFDPKAQVLRLSDGTLLTGQVNGDPLEVVGTFGGYYLYRTLSAALGGEASMRLPAAAIAAWLSVVVASFLVALELWVSDTTSLWTAITAMVGWHLIIGVGEALITVGALSFIAASRADLLQIRDARAQA